MVALGGKICKISTGKYTSGMDVCGLTWVRCDFMTPPKSHGLERGEL